MHIYQHKHAEYGILTAKGLAAFRRCWSPLSLAAETIFIDLVILEILVVPVIRALTVILRVKEVSYAR